MRKQMRILLLLLCSGMFLAGCVVPYEELERPPFKEVEREPRR